jgi:hypothetical protein
MSVIGGPAEQQQHNHWQWHRKPPFACDPAPMQAWSLPLSDDSSAFDDPEYKNNQGQNQQNMNEPAQGVGRHQSQQPQHEQNYENCPKHNFLLWETRCRFPDFVSVKDFLFRGANEQVHRGESQDSITMP